MAVPNLWRTKEQRYRLQGDVCPACSNTIFPPKRVCPHCHHGAAIPAVTDDRQDYAYVMLFEMPQVTELSAVGDD
ncbi:MAG: hypothetical protein KDE53_23490 [Caldilineaceae bacterium]|nr:hypothetical protein [Caldilineaceae bacterium]